MGAVSKIIKGQPDFIKRIFYRIVPFRYRYGPKFNEFCKLLKNADSWSYDQAKDYQLQKLRELLLHCSSNVPYYSSLFKKNGFDPNIKDFDQLKNLPTLDKPTIKKNQNKLLSQKNEGRLHKFGTSGSTGERLDFFGYDELYKIEAAFVWKAYKDQGTTLYDKPSVWIRRYSPKEGDPISYEDKELKRYYMSAFHLNKETVCDYVNFINKSRVELLVSYPSTVHYLATLCREADLVLTHVKYIHGASEVCLPSWRETIKSELGAEIKMHYGQIEKVSFAHQDASDDDYRENLLYGYNEFLEDGSIIATGFHNKAMPFLRYETKDKALLKESPDLSGAFPKTIKDILGRDGDMLLTEKHSKVPAVNFYSFMGKVKEVDAFQITQNKDTLEVDFFIIPNRKFNEDTKGYLAEEMYNRLGNVPVRIILTEELKRDQETQKLKTIALV
jgi:phenylacetate-CoA ligase